MYISKLWKLEVNWDEDLNEDLVTEFKSLVEDFKFFKHCPIPKECMLKVGSRDSPYIL